MYLAVCRQDVACINHRSTHVHPWSLPCQNSLLRIQGIWWILIRRYSRVWLNYFKLVLCYIHFMHMQNNFILQKFIAVKMSVCSIFNFPFMYALKVILKQADSAWNQYFICHSFMMICWFLHAMKKNSCDFIFLYFKIYGLFLLL